MQIAIDTKTVALAAELSRRVMSDAIEYSGLDMATCKLCGADLLQGEEHRTWCILPIAQAVFLGLNREEHVA